jgi:hypothetical protein
MTNLDYTNFETPTGDWLGTASVAPTHYGQYKPLFTDLAGVERPNGIITFDNLPANLKIVSGSGLNLPFNRVFIDIDGYNDYVMLDSNGDGNYSETGANGFMASYTNGGFWLLGDDNGDPPGVIFMATGSAPTGTADILNLNWISIASSDFNSSGSYIDMMSNDAIVHYRNFSQPMSPISGFLFNKNEYSWQKKIFSPYSNDPVIFSYFVGSSGLRVTGADSNGVPKSFLFSYNDLIPEAVALSFWWEENNLTGEIFTDTTGSITPPSPFTGVIIPDTYASYVDATVYADEPMISYSVINNNTIQITSDINSVISPLRKLYVNFSGIS